MRLQLVISLLFLSCVALGQSGRQFRPLYQTGNKFKNTGWHFAPGVTYMFPAQANRSESRLMNIEGQTETLFDGDFGAGGRLGFYLEVGRQHFFEYPVFFHYIDYGLHFKQLRGSEVFDGSVFTQNGALPISNRGSFSDGFIGLYFNANHIFQISDRSFIQGSLGINADYRLFDNTQFEGVSEVFEQEFAAPFQGQLHAKIGFGFTPESGIMIIPSLETPILNVVPMYDGKSTLPYFNSRYRPVILSLRILFFSKNKAEDCVGSGANTPPRGHQLWGDDMQKHYGGKKKKKKKKPRR